MTDQEQYLKLQQDVLGATKTAIAQNAPGLPIQILAAYMRQIGGDVIIVMDDDEETNNELPEIMQRNNPFRIRVTAFERPNIQRATKIPCVKEVKGWG